MLKLRKSEERGYVNRDWLKSYHSFSFATYYDPAHMGWGNLKTINEDYIAPGTGFGKHSHSNMEIITYVLSGELAHQDSMGNASSIPPGDVQRMSAGTGVMHSEHNNTNNQETHLLQIWIEPNEYDIPPSYGQKTIPKANKQGRLCLVASPHGEDGSIKIHADAKLYAGLFDGDQTDTLNINSARKAYVHLINGTVEINGQKLNTGDALLLEQENHIYIAHANNAEILVFDLAA